MKKFLVVCRETGQSASFKRVLLDYTEKNKLPVEWFFGDEKVYENLVETEDIDFVLISPEVLLFEKKIKEELTKRNIEFLSMKPVDFGLKRMEKLMPLLQPHVDK